MYEVKWKVSNIILEIITSNHSKNKEVINSKDINNVPVSNKIIQIYFNSSLEGSSLKIGHKIFGE